MYEYMIQNKNILPPHSDHNVKYAHLVCWSLCHYFSRIQQTVWLGTGMGMGMIPKNARIIPMLPKFDTQVEIRNY